MEKTAPAEALMTGNEPTAPPAGSTHEVYESALPAVDTTISKIRHGLDAFLIRHGVPGARRQDIAIAVTEGVTNVVLHAYRGRPRGDVAVRAEVREGDLLLSVSDTGGGVRPRADSPGMGAGLSLIAYFATTLSIGRGADGSGTRIEVTFGRVHEPPPPPVPPPARDELLRGYLDALTDASEERGQDTAALIAEARQTRSRMQDLRENRPRRTD
jgi:anti-sigma regulatory factor (Ser/Thr protein kinase)